MLNVYLRTRATHSTLIRVLTLTLFAALTALSARFRFDLPFTPVPVTLQVLVVLLAGLVLGAKDGALSQLLYLAALTSGLPIDARGLGPMVWTTPTAGFLLGFVPGAFVAGYLAEKGLGRNRALRFAAGLVGVVVIYACGASWLTLGFLGGDWVKGWTLGVMPFIAVDIVKAVIASGLTEGARKLIE